MLLLWNDDAEVEREKHRDEVAFAFDKLAMAEPAGDAELWRLLWEKDSLEHFLANPAGYRQPSFLGPHDFAALSGGVLVVALCACLIPPGARWERRLALTGGISGALGLVLSGAVGAALGLAGAALWLAILGLKRLRTPPRRGS